MGRTVQNTTLTVGLLTVPVALRKVTQKQDVKLDRATAAGNRVKRIEVDAVTGEVVDGEFRHGRFDGDTFHAIPESAIVAIEEETKIESFAIEHFVPLKDVPWERVQDAYYIAPQSKVGSVKPLKLLHAALAKSKKAGAFKLTLTKRQYPAIIYASNGGLIVNTLAFAADFTQVHEADEAIANAEVKPAEVALAVQLIEANASDADVIDTFEDDLVALKQRLVDEALAGRTITTKAKAPVAPSPSGDLLMESLKASIAETQKKRGKSKVKTPA
jgi:Ku protein